MSLHATPVTQQQDDAISNTQIDGTNRQAAGNQLIKMLTPQNTRLIKSLMLKMSKYNFQLPGPNDEVNESREVHNYEETEETRLPSRQCLRLLRSLRYQNYPIQPYVTKVIDYLRQLMILSGFLQLKDFPYATNAQIIKSRKQLMDVLAHAMNGRHAPGFKVPKYSMNGDPSTYKEDAVEAADPAHALLLNFEGILEDRKLERARRPPSPLVDRAALQRRLHRRRQLLRNGVPEAEVDVIMHREVENNKKGRDHPPRSPYDFEDALFFLNTLRMETKERVFYEDFVRILLGFTNRRLTMDVTIKFAIQMLCDHRPLVSWFNKFLPHGYYIWKRNPIEYCWTSPEVLGETHVPKLGCRPKPIMVDKSTETDSCETGPQWVMGD